MTSPESHVRDLAGWLSVRFKAEDLACRGVPTEELRPGMLAELLAVVSDHQALFHNMLRGTVCQLTDEELLRLLSPAARKNLGLD